MRLFSPRDRGSRGFFVDSKHIDGCDFVADDCAGSAPRLLARQLRDADRTRRLLSPSKDGAGRNLRYGPVPAVDGVVRWRLIDLAPWLFEEFRLVVSKQPSRFTRFPRGGTAQSRARRSRRKRR